MNRHKQTLEDRLNGLYIKIRAKHGEALPDAWLKRPMAFKLWAADLIGEIFREAKTSTVALSVLAASACLARPASTAADWHGGTVCNATRCEICESYARAGKVLKGRHLRELRTVWARHCSWCPFQRAHNRASK